MKAARYTKDNRILPRGFGVRPTADIAEVSVVGEAATDDDFVAGSNRVVYRVALPIGTTAVTVAAELNYQTLSYDFMQDLLRDDELPEVERFGWMHEATDIRAERIVSAAAQINVLNGTSAIDEAPAASFTSSCTDQTCTFRGTGSSDKDGSIIRYTWDFGDGSTAVGAQVSHRFLAADTYNVTSAVTDDAGETAGTQEALSVRTNTSGPGPGPGPVP